MESRSLYLAGEDDPIAILAGGLGIRPERCLTWGDPANDWGRPANEESFLLFTSVGGDFRFAVDVFVFGVDWPDLEAKLAAISTKDLTLALPDEESDRPFDFVWYEKDERRAVEVRVDEAEADEADDLVWAVDPRVY